MISVIIHTYNAEKDLRQVLEAVKDFDEILVCDMYSTDKTIEIAEEYNCRIIYHENTGYAEAARTFGIQSATHPWILTVDADELVTPALKDFLYKAIRNPNCPAGYRIPVKNYFMGKFMRCTYPNYVLRFFKKEGTFWPPYVHTQPQVQGVVEAIPSKRKDLALIHMCDDPIIVNIRKTNLYTENEVKKRKDKKYSILSLILESNFRFIKFYLFKGGILDGKAGFIYSCLLAFYKFTTIAKIIELKSQSTELNNDIKKAFEH